MPLDFFPAWSGAFFQVWGLFSGDKALFSGPGAIFLALGFFFPLGLEAFFLLWP